MMDWLAIHGPTLVLVVFFLMFLTFTFWAYRPSNKNKLEDYGHIPFKESRDGK